MPVQEDDERSADEPLAEQGLADAPPPLGAQTAKGNKTMKGFLIVLSLGLVTALGVLAIAYESFFWVFAVPAAFLFINQTLAISSGAGLRPWFALSDLVQYVGIGVIVTVGGIYLRDIDKVFDWDLQQRQKRDEIAWQTQLHELDEEKQRLEARKTELPGKIASLKERVEREGGEYEAASEAWRREEERRNIMTPYVDPLCEDAFPVLKPFETQDRTPGNMRDMVDCTGYISMSAIIIAAKNDLSERASRLEHLKSEKAALEEEEQTLPGRIAAIAKERDELAIAPPAISAEEQEELQAIRARANDFLFLWFPMLLLLGVVQKIGQLTHSLLNPKPA